MPFFSVSNCALRLQRLQLFLLLVIIACLLLPAVARAQVTYAGSGAVNFGSQAIGTPSAAQTLTFSIASGTTVGSIQVVTQGATGLDFTNAGTGSCTAGSAYSAGATCTVGVTFKPMLPGTRYGAAELLDSSGNVLAIGYLQGAGLGPMVNFLPGIQSTVVSGLTSPTGIAVDAGGNFFITAGAQVLKETLSGGSYTQSTIYGGQSGSSLLGVAVDGGGNVYFVDNGEFTAYKATPSTGGYSITEIASGLDFPIGIAVDGDGHVYINNAGVSQVLEETPLATGGYTQSVIVSDQPYSLWGIAVDGQGNLYLAADAPARFGTEGFALKETLSGGSYTQSIIADIGLETPMGIAVDGNANVYVPLNGGVAKLTPTSDGYTQSNLAITAANTGVAVDGSGNVYALNGGSILKLDLADPPNLAFATTTAGQTSTDSPQTVTLQNAGNSELSLTSLSYPTDFPQAAGHTNACASLMGLAAEQTCILSIDFTPLSVGSLSEDVVLTDDSLNVSGSEQEIAVSGTGVGTVGEATHFAVTTTGSIVAGSPFTLTVTGLDYLGNTATLYNGSVAFTSSDPLFVTPGTLALSGGIGHTTVTLRRAGTQTITATDTTNSALNGTGSFTVAPAGTASLAIAVPVSAIIGNAYPLTVTAEDLYGNQATGYTGTVSFSSTDPSATLPGASTLTSGKGNFSVTFRTAGQQTVTATDSTNHLSVASSSTTVTLTTTAPNEWTWMGGSSTVGTSGGRPGVYGTLGMAAPGNSPGARSGAQTWTDRSGNFWLFGGSGLDVNGTSGSLDDLWELNPLIDYWTWMGGSNTVPAQNGGWPGVYNTMGTPAATNMPGSRSGASTWTDKNGNLWLFGGSGFDAAGTNGYLDDLWKFNPQTNEWTWMGGSNAVGALGGHIGVYGTLGTPAAENMPGSRSGASTWTDSSGHFWLFGGSSFVLEPNSNSLPFQTWYLNDLWEFDPAINEWTWMSGSSDNNPANTSACTPPPLPGSCGFGGVYGSLGIASPGNNPGGRAGDASWIDSSGNLWLFGGFSFLSSDSNSGRLNDVWKFNPSTDEWAWMGGSDTLPEPSVDAPGVYGTLGIPAAGNIPEGRDGSSYWTDKSGIFWLFGGSGVAADGTSGSFNDLWAFNPFTNEWAWMGGGSNESFCNPCGGPGVYGTLGIPAAGNIPGVRSGALSWTDNSGNFWLFGGGGLDANGTSGNLNDLWVYETPLSVPAALTSPTPGSVLGSSPTFTWSAGSGVSQYALWLGTTMGGSDLYNSGHITATSASVTNVPTIGATVYAQLWSYLSSGWQSTVYTFTEGVGGTPPALAALISPAPGSVLGSSATFTWSAGSGVSQYALWLGTTSGAADLYNSGHITATSASVTNLPTIGATVFAQLWSYEGGGWKSTVYTFTEGVGGTPPALSALISPAPGSVLGSSATFTWSAGSDVSQYALWLGTTMGGSDLYNSGHITTTSATVTNLPMNGATVYAQLWSYESGGWHFTVYTFTEQ